jgi:hypothetical protein
MLQVQFSKDLKVWQICYEIAEKSSKIVPLGAPFLRERQILKHKRQRKGDRVRAGKRGRGRAGKQNQNPDPLRANGSAIRSSETRPLAMTYWSGFIEKFSVVKKKKQRRVRHPLMFSLQVGESLGQLAR